METTTKTLNNYRDKEIRDLSLEQLSLLYRQTNEDCIIAEAFEKLQKLIVVNSRQYPQFETSDYASYALEKLPMCLLTYVPSNGNKFTTYFCRVFKNKLREESQYLNTQKRKVIYNSTSLDYLMEEGFDVTSSKGINCNTIVLPNNLTTKEKQYCELLAIDYGTNKEIAERMNVSVMTLCNLRKSLKIKLHNFID